MQTPAERCRFLFGRRRPLLRKPDCRFGLRLRENFSLIVTYTSYICRERCVTGISQRAGRLVFSGTLRIFQRDVATGVGVHCAAEAVRCPNKTPAIALPGFCISRIRLSFVIRGDAKHRARKSIYPKISGRYCVIDHPLRICSLQWPDLPVPPPLLQILFHALLPTWDRRKFEQTKFVDGVSLREASDHFALVFITRRTMSFVRRDRAFRICRREEIDVIGHEQAE